MRQQIVAANWKMHGDATWVEAYCEQLSSELMALKSEVKVVLFPPSPLILQPALSHSNLFSVGPQNFYPQASGAFTGELSLSMLPPEVCQYVLVGHSERRHVFKESEKFVVEKFHYAKERGIVPVLCIGETDEERNNGQTETVLKRQLDAVAQNHMDAFSQVVIAYEPVWAIGTGKTATPELAQEAHAMIRRIVADYHKDQADLVPILYGGSVKPDNAEALFDMPDIDGGLIGGASLDVNQFLDIVKCIS